MSDPGPIPAQKTPCGYRFGLFEADPRSGELRKNGVRIRLQEQPFQVLLVLLERAGEVVSRDELRQRLWSDDTFVDFDHGLNTAINKVREALGDRASSPRFLETLARRGYRFIAPVQRFELPVTSCQLPEAKAGEIPDTTPIAQPTPHGPAGEDAGATDGDLPRPHRGLTRLLFGLAQLMYLVFYIVAMVRLEQIHQLIDDWRMGYGLPAAILVLVSASAGIAIRLYLLTAVSFDYRRLGEKFRRLYPFVLPLDQLWALAPFLLLAQIGVGAAFAACAALLYLPFSERTLVRMAYASW